MRRHGLRSALIGLSVSVILAACGGTPKGTGSPTAGVPTNGATTPAPGSGAAFTSGSAHAEISDGTTLDMTLTGADSSFDPNTAVGALTFSDAQNNVIVLGGRFHDSPTNIDGANALSLSIGGTIGFYSSLAGECTLTFDKADANGVSGSFDCPSIDGGQGPVRITGQFEASA